MEKAATEEFRKAAVERGLNPEKALTEAVSGNLYISACTCLTETDAGKIIDRLG